MVRLLSSVQSEAALEVTFTQLKFSVLDCHGCDRQEDFS